MNPSQRADAAKAEQATPEGRLKRIAALEAEVEQLQEENERLRKPWGVELLVSHEASEIFHERHECRVVDVDYSDRVLVVELCDECRAALAEKE